MRAKKLVYCSILFLSLILSFVARHIRWNIVFAINTGQQEQLNRILPRPIYSLIAKHSYFKRKAFLVGFVYTKHRIIPVISSAMTNKEIDSSASLARDFYQSAQTWQCNALALGGILQSRLRLLPQEHHDSRVHFSNHGTVFMLVHAIKRAIAHHPELKLSRRSIAIVGAGYIGRALSQQLCSEGVEARMLDQESFSLSAPARRSARYMSAKQLSQAGIIVLLTTNGDEGFKSIAPYLLPNMLIISDTYPKVSLSMVSKAQKKGAYFYESYASIPGTTTLPSYGELGPSLLGGCLLQTYVESLSHQRFDTYGDFERVAEKLGISSELKQCA